MVVSGRAKVKKAVMMAAMPELKTAASRRAGFERHDLVFQNLGVRMREARIDQVGALARRRLNLARGDGERVLGRLRTGEDISGAAEDRRPRRPERKMRVEAPVSTAVRGRTSPWSFSGIEPPGASVAARPENQIHFGRGRRNSSNQLSTT